MIPLPSPYGQIRPRQIPLASPVLSSVLAAPPLSLAVPPNPLVGVPPLLRHQRGTSTIMGQPLDEYSDADGNTETA